MGFFVQIKDNEQTQDIPCIVATVVNNEKKAKALGADAFFIHPLDGWLLINTLNGLIKRDTKQTLLLIDDNSQSRYLFKQYLSHTELSCIEANNGAEGIYLAQNQKPQAIVLDLVMPEMSGFEVLKKLKSESATCQIPVIIHTSKPLGDEEQQILTQYALAILSKENPSQDIARMRVREALLKAGLYLKM